MIFQAADFPSDMSETLNSISTRLSKVENENRILKQQKSHIMLKFVSMERKITVLRQDNHRLSDLGDRSAQKIDALEQENSRLNGELLKMKDALSLNIPNTRQNLTSLSDPEPDTRSQFMAFACTNDMVKLSCPVGRTILAVSANYGQFDHPYFECTDCCAPNP